MNFATWSIRNPTPVILLFVLLSVAGVVGWVRLPIQNLPDIELPTVNVTLAQPGAAPAQLETAVARPVEDALANLVGLRHLRSQMRNGAVHISAEFEIGTSLSGALDEVKAALDRTRTMLPDDLLPPAVSADVVGSSPILTYAVESATLDEAHLSWFVDDVLGKALRTVPGVGQVERLGGVQREVRVELDPVRLAALDVTATDVSRALASVQMESSAGGVRLGGGEQSLRTLATVATADALRAVALPLARGRWLRLDQVADVVDGHRERDQAALLDGAQVVGIHVYRTRGSDEAATAAAVGRALDAMQRQHPGLVLSPVSSRVDYTLEQYRGSMQMLLEGAVLAVLVVWWFLRDWRATAVAAMALPLSILPTFALMPWLGFSLNTLTLLALAVVAGILVDDAIVEIENIESHRRRGKSIAQATADAVSEIALAVMATTLTLVVVFLPTAMMPGIAGLLFAQFGWTTVIAVLASLLVARLLTPLLAVHWLRPLPARPHVHGWLMRRYLATVQWALAHRRITLAAAVAFLLGSFGLLPLLPTGFMPAADQGYVDVGVELPPGVALVDSVAAAERVRRALGDVPGVAQVFARVGEPGDGDGASSLEVRRALLTLTLGPRDQRAGQQAIEAQVRERLATLPGARFSVGGGNLGTAMTLILASDDARLLRNTAQTLEQQMRGIPGLANVGSSASLEQPELTVRPDPHRAAELGVTTASIAETIRIALGGDADAVLPRLNLDTRQVLIRVQVAPALRADLAAIGRLRVPGREGPVPLHSIATLDMESGPSQIDRFDRQRVVTLSAGLAGIPLGDAEAAVAALPISQAMPAGVNPIEAGDSELAGELAGGFLLAIGAGLLCMFCVLVLLFKDAFQPLTILSAVPLSLGGALLALLATGSALDVPAMIGLVMLMGIVTKNSILLVDHSAQAMRQQGMGRDAALLDACSHRARPILMTSLAMVAGMLPIAAGLGADASFRQPLAITVIGGLATSTVLSLVVVPVLFTCIDDLRVRLRAGQRNMHPAR
ncbi:RND transporter [Stenotrophomonas rhizophila]|jgi:multidrug efflux pump subunit AcrB|uniref:efflux RND transporter permease subunit n=1 Tax=Stenotrophomonas TaxID=40323 RepID=UPI000BA752DA|nr:efflux RND transporter permease subunit [Stenotrophomonas rhizophila]PAK93416.1 RND transporter [Stenotrophomonas rhizophila]UQY87295.1 efflux RND transporter permease subunit [Stenotrophomonas rhizophila]